MEEEEKEFRSPSYSLPKILNKYSIKDDVDAKSFKQIIKGKANNNYKEIIIDGKEQVKDIATKIKRYKSTDLALINRLQLDDIPVENSYIVKLLIDLGDKNKQINIMILEY